MVVIHKNCQRAIVVRVEWPKNLDRQPLILVDGEVRETCPKCYRPLSFATMKPIVHTMPFIPGTFELEFADNELMRMRDMADI